jgi:hypothetical protein
MVAVFPNGIGTKGAQMHVRVASGYSVPEAWSELQA